jgi:hypothetical protein
MAQIAVQWPNIRAAGAARNGSNKRRRERSHAIRQGTIWKEGRKARRQEGKGKKSRRQEGKKPMTTKE